MPTRIASLGLKDRRRGPEAREARAPAARRPAPRSQPPPAPTAERKRLGRVIGHDPPARQQHHPVGRLGFGEIVGGEEDRGAALAALGREDGPDQLTVLGIEADGGLVEDQEVGPVQRGAGDVHQPPPAARELPRWLRGPRPQSGPVDRGGDCGAHRAAAQPGQARREPQVLLDREQAVDAGLLKHEAEPAPDGAALAHDVVAEDTRAAAGGGEQGGEEQHRCGLAGAVGPEQADQAPRPVRRGTARRAPAPPRSRARGPR